MTRRLPRKGADAGFTLVELAIAMTLMGLLLSVIATTISGSKQSADTVRQVNNLNEEARLALNRITRELRQASSVDAVGAPDETRSVTFWVDFNGNLARDNTAADPEVLTYRWDGSKILLSAASASVTVTQPILSGQVSAFRLDYRSSRYEYDCNGDSVTTWQELDATACGPVGNSLGNGNGVLDGAELPFVDSVVLSFSVLEGARKQSYRTQIDLRNAR